MEDTVYHYCSIETFLNIMQYKTIRITDIEKSNDFLERINIEKRIQDKLEKFIRGKQLDYNSFLYVQNLCCNMFSETAKLYACCFSEEEDLLSQWRAYANNGSGVAIGFSKKDLLNLNADKYGFTFKKICYDITEQDKYIDRMVETIIETTKHKNIFAAFGEVFQNKIAEYGCMKSPAFAEEREWRLCISFSPECRINNEANFQDFHLSPVKVFSRQDKLITYFDVDFRKIKDELIKEIVIGPNCNVTNTEILQCLRIYGINTENMKVNHSEASYRS